MRALANAVSISPNQSGFSCYDPTLAQRLRQAANRAIEPAVLNLRDAAFYQGPAGVANAVKGLWSNIGTYLTSLINYIYTGGESGTDQTVGGNPITGRDLIALLATIGVDLGLLVLTILNPPSTPPIRHMQARFSMPTQTVIRHISSAINTAVLRARSVDLEWVRRHFVHHKKNLFCDTQSLWCRRD